MNIDKTAAWKALRNTLITFGGAGILFGYIMALYHIFGEYAVLIGPFSILIPFTFWAFYSINKEL